MANSTTKPISIYRCTGVGETEATLNDDEAVGMNYGLTDNDDIGVIIFNWDLPDRRADVAAPDQRTLSKPDTGMASIQLKIGIKVNETVADNKKVGILTKWGIEKKAVRNIYSRGRFGIRNDKKPWMNFQPTDTAGWKIVDVNVDDVIEFGGLIDMMVTLEFAGATSELVTQIETVLNA